jgi:DNA-directed RNA polymerase alpha subunit
VRDLVRFTEEELLSTNCFGETSLREMREKLAQRGLRLGMTPHDVARRPINGNIVVLGQASTSQQSSQVEHESPCCGDCEDAARKLRQRVQTSAQDKTEQERRVRERKLFMSLPELELSVRVTCCLESEGITTVLDLVNRSDEELLEVPGFGKKALREVKARLATHGLQTGMKRLASRR